MLHFKRLTLLLIVSLFPLGHKALSAQSLSSFKESPLFQRNFFPIAVWLQNPKNASRYKAAGFNLYVGLWEGPTEEQLADLKKAGIPVVCEQNPTALRHLGDSTIAGWMHGDEPDNAQSLPGKDGEYGPPLSPAKVLADYRKFRAKDPSRPILLNLGQGVAWDGWYGRGIRTNHPEDYPEYLKACDIASYDIYPVVHDNPEIKGNLWFVPKGVDRLRQSARPGLPVWNALECTRISNPAVKPTPRQVRAEAWMSLIHGSRGLIYFVHQFKPEFIEAALLADPKMLAAVTALNRQIQDLAPVLNSPALPQEVFVETSDAGSPVDVLAKIWNGNLYLFAVEMRNKKVDVRFKLPAAFPNPSVEALGEGRSLLAKGGTLRDSFGPYDVHLYKVFNSAVSAGGSAP